MENSRVNASLEYKHSGYNCCQSVVLSYADKLNIEKEDLLNIASGFGMGMGCMEGTCGALCGAVIVAGILQKGERTTLVSKKILQSFKDKCGDTVCKTLKGVETGKTLCSCDDCVKNAVLALDEQFSTEKV